MKQRIRKQSTANQPEHSGNVSGGKCFYSNAYRHMKLSTSALESSQAYQRKVDPRHVDEIIDNFNALYLDEVIVSYRGGKYYVVDGQNRIAAFMKMNGDHDCMVNCKVFQGLSYEDEAAMFYHLDAIKNKMKYHEKVKAMAEAGDNPAVQDIKRILSDVGLHWCLTGSKSGSRHTVSASQALIDCHETYGGLVMYHAMNLLVQTWNGDGSTLTAPFIKGICLFARTYAQHVTLENFARKLRDSTAGEIKMLAQQETAVNRQDLKYAKAFLRRYNHNRQAENRLPDLLDDTSGRIRRARATA